MKDLPCSIIDIFPHKRLDRLLSPCLLAYIFTDVLSFYCTGLSKCTVDVYKVTWLPLATIVYIDEDALTHLYKTDDVCTRSGRG